MLPRPFIKLTLLFQPFLRIASSSFSPSSLSRKVLAYPTPIPPLSYPLCVRNFTCSAPTKQDFGTIMADMKKEVDAQTQAQESIHRMAEPALSSEAEILDGNSVRDEVLGKGGDGNKRNQKSNGKAQEGKEKPKEAEKLPKLSAADFAVYNSMAEHMEYFHNHFRQTWTTMHTACVQNRRPTHLSLPAFINLGLQLNSHLTAHHRIEETHIFPVLARKMPEFRNTAELLRQHKEIHKGMDGFEAYLRGCKDGEWDFEMGRLREKMDCWGEVLWTHLDEEVRTLGAENMRKYWSLEEMRRMPM